VRFWDSSALVPLVVRQAGSAEAERWLAEDAEVVAWTLTAVEVISALRRFVRDGGLSERVAWEGEAVATELLERSHLVSDLERVKSAACRLLRVHALRAADALQLGAALSWADGDMGLIVHTLDHRLALAAEREGFRVIPGARRS
jgi:uncharacterized protein